MVRRSACWSRLVSFSISRSLHHRREWRRGGGGGDGLDAGDFVEGDAEGLGETRQEMGGRPSGLALVVGHHPLREADQAAELGLGEALGLAESGEALAEGLGGRLGHLEPSVRQDEVGGHHRGLRGGSCSPPSGIYTA